MGMMIARIRDMDGSLGFWGGKALPLRALAEAGFSVPEGFCLGTEAFTAYLRYNRIPAGFQELTRHPGRRAARIREASFPPEMTAAVKRAFADLVAAMPEGASFIARSSSPLEDGREFSGAGLFESIEGIRDEESLLEAIKACWASLYSDRALAALLERQSANGRVDVLEPRMAVLVQAWIPGDLSGVCFTCDVKEGRTDRLALNWVEGSCRGLVDGSAPSSVALFAKGSHEPICAPTGEGDGLEAIRTSLEEFERVEAILGHPCDIEWTHDGERLWILQARPVTTLRLPPAVLPEWLSEPGWKPIPYLQPFRPLEEEAWLASMEGARRAGDEQACGFLREDARCFRGHAYTRPAGLAGPATVDMAGMANRAIAAGTDLYHDDALPRILQLQRPMASALRRGPSGASAAGLVTAAIGHARQSAYLHWTAVWGLAYVEPWAEGVHSLRQDLPELYEDLSQTEIFDLLYAPSAVTKVRSLTARAAACARRNPHLAEAFASTPSDRLLSLRLPALPGGRAVLRFINRLLKLWGLSQLEGDWRDPLAIPPALAPWLLLGEIRWYLLGRLPERDPAAALMDRQRKLERGFLASLPAARRRFARKCLKQARAAFITREEHALHFDTAKFGFFAAAAQYVGRAAAGAGMIGRWDDIYFFSSAEIEAAIQGSGSLDAGLLASRRADWEESRDLRVPGEAPMEALSARGKGLLSASTEPPSEAELTSSLAGQATMEGIVRGRAWFPEQGAPSDGDPLVLVVADERSILIQPYLTRIAALVYDQGSPFSHLAISAREWGIPALYGTKTACAALRNGQPVILDGKAGLLRY